MALLALTCLLRARFKEPEHHICVENPSFRFLNSCAVGRCRLSLRSFGVFLSAKSPGSIARVGAGRGLPKEMSKGRAFIETQGFSEATLVVVLGQTEPPCCTPAFLHCGMYHPIPSAHFLHSRKKI
jgi:hypothetical protein